MNNRKSPYYNEGSRPPPRARAVFLYRGYRQPRMSYLTMARFKHCVQTLTLPLAYLATVATPSNRNFVRALGGGLDPHYNSGRIEVAR